MECMKKLIDFICCRNSQIAPQTYYCTICFEEGKLRHCCKSVLCDYDYTKDKFCPICKNSTKMDKVTGAVFMIPHYSEHEECRICLGPGLKRRCCGQYYCDECYYQFPECRSCGQNTSKRGLNQQLPSKASILTVLLGWIMTIFILISISAVIVVLVSNENRVPVGIFGYHCYSFFTGCGTKICFEVNSSVVTGPYDAMDALTNWKMCDLDSQYKIQAQACIFDESLFSLTDGNRGFDVCEQEYEGGAYVFEDTFEHWQEENNFTSNLLRSATWNTTVNAQTTGYCGVGEHTGGSKALTFNGEFYRYVETSDVDVIFGGFLEAELFLAPVGYDATHMNCKTAYSGAVEVSYSINYGQTWQIMQIYQAWKYRQSKFFPVKLYIPNEAKTTHTRFRFNQPTFEASRDAWALDNVRVYHFYDSNWKDDTVFKENVVNTKEPMQFAQCCFDTDWCESTLSENALSDCFDIPWYDQTIYSLRGTEMYICITVLIALIKFSYVSGSNWLVHRRFPFNDEFDNITQLDRLFKMLPPHWRPKRSMNTYKDIHESARLNRALRETLNDVPVMETAEEIQNRLKAELKMKKTIMKKKREKEKEEKRRLKRSAWPEGDGRKKTKREIEKENKKLEEAAAAAAAYDMENLFNMKLEGEESKDMEELEKKLEDFQASINEGPKDTEIDIGDDDIKKMDLSLKIPIDLEDNHFFKVVFASIVLFILAVLFLFKASIQADYTLSQDLMIFGVYKSKVEINSGGILLFALFSDSKEIYYTLMNIIPLVPAFVPMVTLDTTFDVNSMFVGNYQVRLEDITQAHTFSTYFTIGNLLGLFLGCFPWCLFSMIIRDYYLPFDIMRILAPSFGAICIIRSLLGPFFVHKIVFSALYILRVDYKTREEIGTAFKAEKTRTGAINAALIFACIGGLFCTVILLDYAALMFGVFLFVGFLYGGVTGCIHDLSIKPWMYFTTISDGVWLKLKKKKRCPCDYWGKYCTDMHDASEIFIIFPKDRVLFLSKLKGGSNV